MTDNNTHHSAVDKEVAKEYIPASTNNTPLSQEKGVEDTPSHQSKDELDLEVQKAEAETTTPAANVEYPVGFRLAAIVIALILSIFLVALDMTVSPLG